MRIGLFTDAYFPIISGVSLSVDILANKLREKGHVVFIICSEHEKSVEDPYVIRIKGYKYPMKGMREYRFTAITNKLIKNIASYQFDLVHCHTEFTMGRLGRRVGRKLQVPVVHTYHTMYEEYVHFVSETLAGPLRLLAKWYSRRFANSADEVVFPTIKVKRTFDRYGFKGKSHVIPTGIEISQFNPSLFSEAQKTTLKEKLNIPHNAFVILFLGRISREKSIDKLINFFAELNDDSYLLIVGDGPDLELFKEQAINLGIMNKIRFTGMIDPKNVPIYYQVSNLFLNFSTSETQGLTYVEALASALPVVAKYDDNLEGIIINGENGYTFDDNEQAKQYIHTIKTNKTFYQKLSFNALQSAKKISADAYRDAIEEIYFHLVKGKC